MLSVRSKVRRAPRLLAGLLLFGVGLGLVVQGDYGLTGWNVFHQGLAEQTPLTIGTATIVVGAVVLLVVLALREPVGIGTVANVAVVGLAIDATVWAVEDFSSVAVRVAFTLSGPLIVGLASGLYLGVRLGPGPRDGIMTAMVRRGTAVWKARFGIELAALGTGLLLGGTVGWGTIWFLVVIGPAVQFFVAHLAVPMEPGEVSADRRAAPTR